MTDQPKTNRQQAEETVALKGKIRKLKVVESESDRAGEALRKSELLMRAINVSARDAVLMMDVEGRISYWNPAADRIFGYTSEEAIGRSLHSMLAPQHYRKLFETAFPEFQRSGCGNCIEKTLRRKALRKNGEEFPVELSLASVQLHDGWHAVGIIRDISDRDLSDKTLRESEDKFRAYMEKAPLGIFVADHTGRYVEVNRAACRMSGYTEEELLELSIPDFLAPDFLGMWMASFEKLKTEGHSDVDLMVRRKNGEAFWINLVSTTIDHDRVLAFCQDITNRKQAEAEIQQMAYHDSLTGLPNRKLFSDRMGVALAQARRDQKGVAVIMLDLDNFKDVNDTLGHDVGDRLLIAAAERLSAALRKSDTVARFGGDEFVLVLPDLKGEEDVTHVARKIVEAFRKPFLIDTHQLIVTTSIGIAVYPQDGTTEVILLKNADIAMYQVKQRGRDRYQLFSPTNSGLARADGTKNAV